MCTMVRYTTYKFSWSWNKSSKASLNSAGGSGRGFPVSAPKRALGQSERETERETSHKCLIKKQY